MPTIHPSAVVEPGAQLGADVVVGPMCYVGARVSLGAGTRLVAHVTVMGRTTLGSGNTVWPQAVLGADPQDLKYRGEETELVIGNDNDIRELVTAHTGTANGGGVTRVGDENLIMGGVHIAHDCDIGNHVILANNVGLAGHVKVEDHANLGGAVGVHHFVTFGQYCYVGGMSRIVHDVPPFMLVEGHPACVRGVNIKGLLRHRFPVDVIDRLKDCHRRLYRGKVSVGIPDAPGAGPAPGNPDMPAQRDGGASMRQRLDNLAADFPDDECVQILVQSLRNTAAGLLGRHREGKRRDDRRLNPAD